MSDTSNIVMGPILAVGDEVIWSGALGCMPWMKTVVRTIERDCTEVDDVYWDDMIDRRIVVSLSNGYWAYGHQVVPVWSSIWTKCRSLSEFGIEKAVEQ